MQKVFFFHTNFKNDLHRKPIFHFVNSELLMVFIFLNLLQNKMHHEIYRPQNLNFFRAHDFYHVQMPLLCSMIPEYKNLKYRATYQNLILFYKTILYN